MSDPWRVGRRVPVNVYVGDTIAGQFQTATLARVAVEAVNVQAELEAQLADALALLAPFVRHNQVWMDEGPDDVACSACAWVTYGHLRRARAALARASASGTKGE